VRKKKHLGMWHIVCDVAGRVTRKIEDPVLTVGAVAVPPELVRELRTALRRLPGKWRVGGVPGLRGVTDRIVSRALPVLGKYIYRSAAGHWDAFWTFGEGETRRLEGVVGRKLPYLQPGTLLRTWLFLQAASALIGAILKARLETSPGEIVVMEGQRYGASFVLVNDTDIQDTQAKRLFSEYIEYWVKNPTMFLKEIFGIEPEIAVAFESEGAEPLLLLADYVAGAFHHANERARIFDPVAPREEIRAVIRQFRQRHGGRLIELHEDFAWKHPLA
jgi:hypothetical protein